MVELYGRVGGEFVVNGNTDQFQGQSATARLASGEFLIVWTSFVSTGVFEVLGQRYSADGAPAGGTFPVTTVTGNLGDPRVEALSTGGFVVTWTYDLHDGTGTNAAAGTALRIHAQIFDSASEKLGGELTLTSGTLVNHSDSQPIALAGGGFAVGYSRSTSTNNVVDSDVVVQLFDSAGTATGAVTRISASSTASQITPSLASLAGGGFVATWQDVDSSGLGIKAQLFDSAGAKLGGEFVVNTVTDNYQYQPTVAALGSGGFVITWTHLNPVGNPAGNDIKGQVFSSAGAKVGGEFVVNTVTADHQHNAYVASLADGGFVVGWRDPSTGEGDIAAQAFDSSGAKQGSQFMVNTQTEGSQGSVALVGLANGGFVATWTGSDASGPGVKAQVFAADVPPTDIALSATTLNENAVENIAVATLSATGAVNGDFSYEILFDSTGGAFRVDGDKLVVDDNAKLDFETAPQASLTIRVTDSDGRSHDEDFVLQITDIAQERRLSAGDPFLANVTQSGEQGSSVLVPLVTGGFALLWGQYQAGNPGTFNPNPFKTILRFFDSAGAPVSGEIVVAQDFLYEPAVTPLANGGLLIAVAVHDEPAGMNSVKVQAYDSAGNPAGAPIFAGSVPNTEGAESPAAAELESGLYAIGWSDGPGALFAQLYTSGGAPVGERIDIAPTSSSESLSLKATPDGGFAAAWWNDYETGPFNEGPFDVGVRFFDSSGVPSGPAILIPAGDLAVEYVDIIALADGGYVLGWVERVGVFEGIPINAVKAQLIDSDGALSGEPMELARYVLGDDSGPDVSFSAHPDGGFLVTWPLPNLATADFETGYLDYSLNAQLFDSLGQPVGPLFQPTPVEGGGISTILADGTIVANWTGTDSSGSGVYARTFRPADEPVGNLGDDQFYGDDNPNTLDGGEGDDQLYGMGGDDDLSGGAGGDLLDGGTGADSMAGGIGNDSYYVDDSGDVVTENPGEGTDEIRTSLAVFSLAGLPDVEYLTGLSDSGQSLTGNAADNVVNAGTGNDFIDLQSGGNDYALGNQGNDVFLFGASLNSGDQVDGGDGIDQIAIQGDYTGANALYLDYNVSGVENLAILPGSDMRFGDPGTESYSYEITITDSVLGEGVQMVIDASQLRSGEDLTVDGSAETDGSFFIYGGAGADRLTGGANNDVFIFGGENQWGAGDIVTGGDGIDQLALRGDYSIAFGAGQLVGIEQIAIVSAQDTRFGALGSSYSYALVMHDSNVDSIQMTIDAGLLRTGEILTFDGSAEDDGSFRVFGGLDRDSIVGSQNGDIIAGNGASDILTGGGGADVFRYLSIQDSALAASDHITDFTSGTDRIDLSRIDADTLTEGNQAFNWIGPMAFTGTAGQLRASEQRGTWFVEGDVDGNGFADFVIILSMEGQATLITGDFIL